MTTSELERLRVVLVNTRNPLNIGAAARAMSNFGVSELRVVNPYEPGFREAKSAVGAAALLKNAREYGSVAEAVADCSLVVATSAARRRNLQHQVRRIEDGARLIRRRLKSSRVAILFGSEKSGLSNEEMSHADWLMRIPTSQQNLSMNLGQAVAVCLYELVRDAKTPREPEKAARASAEEIERITQMLLDALHASGYVGRRRVADIDERIRRLVKRLHVPERDTVLWFGILHQIVWKLRSGGAPEDHAANDLAAEHSAPRRR
ncbi:MAG TPA: TrmJ/YjtD family RNA methyltransferase [Candidatus Acidoferrales bacterium]|nr:TrmJ/YjtD family RNA methyltransferase [Candidatus Acidoferrales bacterium]